MSKINWTFDCLCNDVVYLHCTNVSTLFKPEKYTILFKVKVRFIWLPITIAYRLMPADMSKNEQGSQQTWLNVT